MMLLLLNERSDGGTRLQSRREEWTALLKRRRVQALHGGESRAIVRRT